MTHVFLSDPWLDEVKRLSDEAGVSGMPPGVQLNLVVTGGPEGDRELHVADGTFGTGRLDGAPTTLTVPYEVAKAMFVNNDQAAAMQAFMTGQIKVEGDISKLMAMQAQPPNPDADALQAQVRAITAD